MSFTPRKSWPAEEEEEENREDDRALIYSRQLLQIIIFFLRGEKKKKEGFFCGRFVVALSLPVAHESRSSTLTLAGV
jgi:hypothetical protein